MIWIGTSGWVYPHWIGRFYPTGLSIRSRLSYYAHSFPTVEINRSFYRLPNADQFRVWAEQVEACPHFLFAVKASRYLTHMKKLLDAEEGIARLKDVTRPLGEHLGSFLYQLPPHWRANLLRLEQFISHLPKEQKAAFEFRDPTWFHAENLQALRHILGNTGHVLVTSVGGPLPTPLDLPAIGPFSYIRVHNGEQSIGLSDAELGFWAQRLITLAEQGREVYVYFNNDQEAFAVHNALRLRELVGSLAAQVI
jgi:uncharacterized protein YecE (DUF72 family)